MRIYRSVRWRLKVWKTERENRMLAGQVTGAAVAVAGIAMWSLPSALIVGGLALVLAIELQP